MIIIFLLMGGSFLYWRYRYKSKKPIDYEEEKFEFLEKKYMDLVGEKDIFPAFEDTEFESVIIEIIVYEPLNEKEKL